MEGGDNIAEVAKRFNLPLKSTKALKRSESFAGLSQAQMAEVFQEKVNSPKLISMGENQLIVVPVEVIKAKAQSSKEEMEVLRSKAQADMSQILADELLKAYSSNYKVKIKEKYLGLNNNDDEE